MCARKKRGLRAESREKKAPFLCIGGKERSGSAPVQKKSRAADPTRKEKTTTKRAQKEKPLRRGNSQKNRENLPTERKKTQVQRHKG